MVDRGSDLTPSFLKDDPPAKAPTYACRATARGSETKGVRPVTVCAWLIQETAHVSCGGFIPRLSWGVGFASPCRRQDYSSS